MQPSLSIESQLEDLIVQEAISGVNDSSTWETLLDLLVIEYIKRKSIGCMPIVVKLAMSVFCVGCKDKSLLPAAFSILRCWEFTSGPYWVVMEELLRHTGIGILENEDSFKMASVKWDSLLSSFDVGNISPPLLKQRLLILSIEIQSLIGLKHRNFRQFEVTFLNYKDANCFDRFVEWFNNWARQLLLEYPIELSYKVVGDRFDLHCSDPTCFLFSSYGVAHNISDLSRKVIDSAFLPRTTTTGQISARGGEEGEIDREYIVAEPFTEKLQPVNKLNPVYCTAVAIKQEDRHQIGREIDMMITSPSPCKKKVNTKNNKVFKGKSIYRVPTRRICRSSSPPVMHTPRKGRTITSVQHPELPPSCSPDENISSNTHRNNVVVGNAITSEEEKDSRFNSSWDRESTRRKSSAPHIMAAAACSNSPAPATTPPPPPHRSSTSSNSKLSLLPALKADLWRVFAPL